MYLPAPYLGLVSNPVHYSITALPKQAKQQLEQYFKDDPKLKGIIEAMWARDDSDQIPTMAKYIKILDTQRSQDFASIFPDMYNILGEEFQTLYNLY